LEIAALGECTNLHPFPNRPIRPQLYDKHPEQMICDHLKTGGQTSVGVQEKGCKAAALVWMKVFSAYETRAS